MNILEKSGENLCFCGSKRVLGALCCFWSERLLAQFISVAIVNGLLFYLVCRLNGVA